MSRIEKFEDLICWQKSRILVREIYEITFRSSFCKDFALRDQIRRASLSIMLNIAEGFGRRTHKEFKQFLFIAHGSIAEVQSCLYVASDLTYIQNDIFESLYDKCTEISKIISGLIKSLK
jgi:four helix bundle protein